MKIIYDSPRTTVQGFADKHKLNLRILNRGAPRAQIFEAYFIRATKVIPPVSAGIKGSGSTVLEAIQDYVDKISGRIVQIGNESIKVPLLAPFVPDPGEKLP
jgi:hypothetical protein